MKSFAAILMAIIVTLAAAPMALAHPGHAHDGSFAMYVAHAARWLDDGIAIVALVGLGIGAFYAVKKMPLRRRS
jgi:hydrogenase/urease accessory protein HupE